MFLKCLRKLLTAFLYFSSQSPDVQNQHPVNQEEKHHLTTRASSLCHCGLSLANRAQLVQQADLTLKKKKTKKRRNAWGGRGGTFTEPYPQNPHMQGKCHYQIKYRDACLEILIIGLLANAKPQPKTTDVCCITYPQPMES